MGSVPIFLWRKFWLLFTVIWLVVAALNVFSILAFAEGELDREKVWMPLAFGILVPAALYLVGLLWETLIRRK
jgi:hypothetical protein